MAAIGTMPAAHYRAIQKSPSLSEIYWRVFLRKKEVRRMEFQKRPVSEQRTLENCLEKEVRSPDEKEQ